MVKIQSDPVARRRHLLRGLLGLDCDLEQARERAAWSQADLAAEIGVTREFISQIERGTSSPSIETLDRLRCALFARLCVGS